MDAAADLCLVCSRQLPICRCTNRQTQTLRLPPGLEMEANDADEPGGSSAPAPGVLPSKRDLRWDALLGINPSAWWASLRRTPQLLRQRAFHTRTLADALEASMSCAECHQEAFAASSATSLAANEDLVQRSSVMAYAR